MAKELNNASSPLSPVGAKIFGADASGAAGFIKAKNSNPSVAVLGDSLTGQGWFTDATNTNISPTGWWAWAFLQMGQPFERVFNHGVPGDTTAMMLARISQVIADNPALCFVLGGINDVFTGVGYATTISNLQQIYTTLQKNGSTVVAMTFPSGSSVNTAAEFEAYYKVNDWIRTYSAENNLYFVDIAAVFNDPSTKIPLASLSGDALHPNVPGAQRIGRAVAAAMANVIPPRRKYTSGLNDFGNLVFNGAMVGDNASGANWGLLTGTSGNGPTGWFASRHNGGGLGVCSKSARTDLIPGSVAKIAVTAEGAATGAAIRQVINIATSRLPGAGNRTIAIGERLTLEDGHNYVCTTAGFATSPPTAASCPANIGGTVADGAATLTRVEDIVVGDTVRGMIEFTTDSWSAPACPFLTIECKNSSNATILQVLTMTPTALPEITPTAGVLMSRRFTIPEGTATINFIAGVAGTAAATGNVLFDRAELKKA